jgi:hypothetical protein
MKQLLDDLMKSEAAAEGRVLKVSEAMKVLDFLTYVALANSSIRPKSRRYLDWIGERFGQRPGMPQPGGLIIPG